VEVFLRDTLVAQGADSVNAVVSLAGHVDQSVRFVFVATNLGGGSTRAETGEFRVARPDGPRLEIVHPKAHEGHYRLLTSRVRLKVECPAPPGCVSITAFLGETPVAQGTSALDTVVSLAGFPHDTVSFRFEGVSRLGTTSTVRTSRFRVDTNPYWTEVLTVPGTLKDVDGDRVVYETGFHPRKLHLLNLRTGADSILVQGYLSELPVPVLIPGGVVLAFPTYLYPSPTPGELRELGGSNVRGRHIGFAVRGQWVTWVDSSRVLHRDDALAPRLTRTLNVLAWKYTGRSEFHLAEDGTVAYAGLPQGYTEFPHDVHKVQIYLLRPGGEVEQITSDPGILPSDPRTDGTNVVYTAQPRSAGGSEPWGYRLMLHTPGGKVPLTPLLKEPPAYSAAANGWVVYGFTDSSPDPEQVWARSPSGEVRRITSWAEGGRLYQLGPAGQIILERESDRRRFVAATPFSPLVELGEWNGLARYRWIEGRLHMLIGGSLIRIDR
jgi:hypothetical protein